MYNIDFRVNGQILSIPICLNDTLSKLISRMKQLQPFRKYDNFQLQDKLIRSLKAILNKSQLESNVRKRIIELINNGSYQNQDRYEIMDSKTKTNSLLNTPHQQSSTYYNISQNSLSTKRLNRKYDLKSYELDQSYENPIQNQLNFKYKHQKQGLNRNNVQQKYSDQIKQYDVNMSTYQKKVNVSDYLGSRKYSYNYQQGLSHMKRSINDDNLRGSIDPIKHNESLSYYKQNKQRDTINKSFSQQRIPARNIAERRANIDHLVSITYKRPCQQPTNNNYNPVPKLNELIDRSRSLSQIARKDSLQQNRLQSRDLNRSTNQTKFNVGKIQHRPNYNIDSHLRNNDINYKQNYLPLRSKPYTFNDVPSNISHEHKRMTNTSSYLNQTPLQVKNNNYAINLKQQNYKPNKKVYSYL